MFAPQFNHSEERKRRVLGRLNEIYTKTLQIAIIFVHLMRHIHYKVRSTVFSVLDFFYPVFRRFLPLQTYHYAACGGFNTAMNLLIYFLSYNYLFNREIVYLGSLAFEPHIAALFLSFAFTLPAGFYLSMFVIFKGSYLKRKVQLFRYMLVILGCMIVNYVFLKFFVEVLHLYPTPSQMITTGFVILFNYFAQRYFSFRSDKKASVQQGIGA